MKNKISITLNAGILKRIDSIVDGLIVRNRSQAIEVVLKRALDREKIAVILLGGPEEKIRITDKFLPELEIKDTTLIERQIRKLRESNFREIFVIARKKVLESVFGIMKDGKEYGIRINYVEEKTANGSADTLRGVRNMIKDTFLVLFGDIIFDSINLNELWHSHSLNPAIATLNLITYQNPSVKGEVTLEGSKIITFNQKPEKRVKDESYLVFSPIFICEPELLQYKGSSLEEDIFPVIIKKNLLNGYVSATREFHIHNKENLEEANLIIKR